MLCTWHLGLASSQSSINGGCCYYDYYRAGIGFWRPAAPRALSERGGPGDLNSPSSWSARAPPVTLPSAGPDIVELARSELSGLLTLTPAEKWDTQPHCGLHLQLGHQDGASDPGLRLLQNLSYSQLDAPARPSPLPARWRPLPAHTVIHQLTRAPRPLGARASPPRPPARRKLQELWVGLSNLVKGKALGAPFAGRRRP